MWHRVAGLIGALLIAAPTYASDVVVESRPVASWQRERSSEYQSADKWLRLQNQVDQLQQELQALRGQVEENQHALDKQSHEARALFEDVDHRLGKLSAQMANATTGQAMAAAPANVEVMTISQMPQDEKQAYDWAYDFLEAKDYMQALDAFTAFKGRYPSSEYMPNVQYWLGEIYLLGQDLESADEAFEQVVELYPGHAKAADALLKRGYVQYTLENWTLARAYFNDVKARFKGTSAARLAEARLVQMKQNKQF